MPEDPFKKYGGQEVKDTQEDPFKKYGGSAIVEPVKKKEPSDLPSLVGSIGGQSLSEAQSQSQRSKLTDYVKSISKPATKELSMEAKQRTIAATQGVKPFDSKHPYSEDKLNHDAAQKVADVFMSNDDRYKDPFKYLNSDMSVSSERDLLVNDRARNILAGELMPTGYDAQRILNTTHLGGEPETNVTKQYLQNAATKYNTEVQELKNLPKELVQANANSDWYDYNTTPAIESAAIKWRMRNDKEFATDIQKRGVNPNDPLTLDSYKLGETLNAYLQNPDVKTYFNQENPSMLNAAQRASQTLLTKNTDYGKNVVAQEVSQAVQKSGYNSIDPIVNYYGQNHKEYADLVAKDLYRDNPEKLAIWNKYIKDNQEEYMDAPSFFQRFAKRGGDVLKGVPNTLLTYLKGSHMTDVTAQDIQDKWDKQAKNVSADPQGLSKFFSDFGDVAGLVLGVAAVGNVTGISNPTNAGIAATGLAFFGNEIEAGKEKYPNNPLLAFVSGAGNTAMYMALASDLFPAEKAKKAFQSVKPEIDDVAKQLTSGAITREATRSEMNTIAKKAFDLAGGAITKSAKTAAEMGGIAMVNRMMDGIFMDNENFQKYHPDDELVKTLGHTFLTFLPVSGLAKLGEMRSANTIARESYYALAQRPKYFASVISELAAKDPSINKEELLSNLYYISQYKKDLDYNRIPIEKQKKLIYNELLKKVAKENAPQTPDTPISKLHEEQINKLDEESEKILNEKEKVNDYQQGVNSVSDVLGKMNNAEYINEHELNKNADVLYNILDEVDKSDLSDEHKSSLSNLIEPLINKIEGYEFRTKTKVGTITEKVPTGRTAKIKISDKKPVLEGSAGKPVTITTSSGNKIDGVLRIENGNYVVYNENGDKVSVIGEKALTDLWLRFPDENVMPNPISFDKNGNVSSVTFQTKDGKLVEIKDKEKALDLAIRLQADAIGEVPDKAFQEIYDEVQKEIEYEVLANSGEEIKPQEQKASEPIPEPDNGKTNTEGEQQQPEVATTPEPQGEFVGKKKAILNRVFNGQNTPQYIKDRMAEKGLEYTPISHEERAEFAKSVVDELGIDDAVEKAESHTFDGGVNTAVFTEALDRLYNQEREAKTDAEKLSLAAKQADIYIRFDEFERKNGRDISQVNDFKRKSPLGLTMAQNERMKAEYDQWAKTKDKSWKEYFDDLMKEPEFAKIFSEEVESKSKESRSEERKSRREKVHKAIDDTMAKWAKKLSIDNPNDIKKAGGGDIKTILNAAGKTMKAAYDAGEAIAKVVKDAIDYISKELGHDNWPKEEFEKEWTAKLSSGKKVLTDEEIKGKVLDKFRKKLAGLSEKEKDEVIRRSYRKIVESGGLDYEEFREIIGRVTGRSEMTPEETAKFKQLVEVSNSAAEAQSKLLAERTEKAHREFLDAEKAASKARRELNEMIWNKPNIMQRLTSIMQLTTLGFPALIANVAYNITYQVGVRFPVSLLKSLGENVYRLYDSEYKPETNVLVSQGSFFKKMGLGIKESISQIWTGLNRKDYTQKEIYAQSIRPLHAIKDLWAYSKREKQLSGYQIIDKSIQATFGVPAEIIGRLLNVGDKPLRFGAEGAQAAVFAKQLGLKGMDFKLFLEFPKEEAYRNYIAKGLSPEEAGKKAEIVYNTIIKEGERATFQQDNLANDAISSVFEKIFGSKRSGVGSFVKALTVSPYLKIPINAWWSMYNLLNPEIAVTQSIAYARKGYLEKGKDDIASHASYRQSKYWAAHAAVGIATRAVILQLVSAGIFRPASTGDDTKKEREGELFYEPQGTFNITKFWAYINGNNPDEVKHSITIQNRWFGQWGTMGNAIAQKYYDATPEQRDSQHGFWDVAFGGMEREGLIDFQNNVFGQTSNIMKGINDGFNGRNMLLNYSNMIGNIVDPAALSQISRAQLPYYSTTKADSFSEELKNSMLQRSSVLRNLEGKYPPTKINIWGEPMMKPGSTFERLFGINHVNKDNFAQPIYEDANRTGDIGFFPPSIKPELAGKKLPTDKYNELQALVGKARATVVAPYINDMANIEVVRKKYSELSDDRKKQVLSFLYGLGYKQGLSQFVKNNPEYVKEAESIKKQMEDELFNSWEELKKQ